MNAQDIWPILSALSPFLTLGVLIWWRRTDHLNARLKSLEDKMDEVMNVIMSVNEEVAELRGASHKHTGGPAVDS